jgi:hypothetical protein
LASTTEYFFGSKSVMGRHAEEPHVTTVPVPLARAKWSDDRSRDHDYLQALRMQLRDRSNNKHSLSALPDRRACASFGRESQWLRL